MQNKFKSFQYEENSFEENNFKNKIIKKSINYSGTELFKGLFFAKGFVADNLTNINNSYSYYLANNLTSEQNLKYDNEIDSVINEIKSKYPNYFEDFKNKIESGSHIIITETLEDGAKKLFEAYVDKFVKSNKKEQFVNTLKKVNIDNYISVETGNINYEQLYNDLENNPEFQNYFQTRGFIGVVLVVAAYVLVVHAAAAMTYVYVAWVAQSYAAVTKATAITKPKKVSNKSIDDEMLINEIAEKFIK